MEHGTATGTKRAIELNNGAAMPALRLGVYH